MATWDAQSQKWPADRAVLFVHGIGNAKPGDYTPLVERLRTILGDDARHVAFYFLYYDQINEWFSAKEQAAVAFEKLLSFLRMGLDATNLGNAAAAFAGDVIWPILLADARLAVRAAVLQQLQQIVADGEKAGTRPRDQHVSIIAHSLGCFHVYEALAAAASDPASGLGPATWGVRLDSLILMASPVQLIRSAAARISGAIPQPETMFSASAPTLEIPGEPGPQGERVLSAKRTIAVAGNLDPVGGYVLRKQLTWGYMKLPGQESVIDQQQVASVDGSEELTLQRILQDAIADGGPPAIAPVNPHDWGSYVDRHAPDLPGWLAPVNG
jgi:hypothetical protein